MPQVKSLARQAAESSADASGAMAVFGEMPSAPISGTSTIPYVGFAPMKGDKLAEFRAEGFSPGDPYLATEDGTRIKLAPFRFLLGGATEFWVRTDDFYKALEVTREPQAFGSDLRHTVESFVIAFTDRGLVPALCTWRGARTAAAKVAVDALVKAATPEWGKLSAAHQATLRIPVPQGRFVVTARCITKTSKGGRPFGSATATVAPIAMGDLEVVGKFFGEQTNLDAIKTVREAYEQRVAGLVDLCS